METVLAPPLCGEEAGVQSELQMTKTMLRGDEAEVTPLLSVGALGLGFCPHPDFLGVLPSKQTVNIPQFMIRALWGS